MKTKQVFPTDEVAHIWASQRQDSARNSAHNFYFNDRTIYSYGSHFPIAEIMKDKPNVIFFTTHSYSNTTSKHISLVRRAIPDYINTIYVNDPKDVVLYNSTFWKNIEYFYQKSIEYLKEANLPRKRANTINELQKSSFNELEKIIEFLKVFDLTIDTLKHKDTGYNPTLEKVEFKAIVKAVKERALILEGNKELIQANTALIAKANKQLEARNKKAKQEAQKEANRLLQYWLIDSVDDKGRQVDSYRLGNLTNVYLRAIPKDKAIQVETSMGARVDIKRAKLLYKAIKAGKDILGFDIDGYMVVEKTDEYIKIGCHKLLRTEINRFASLQGW